MLTKHATALRILMNEDLYLTREDFLAKKHTTSEAFPIETVTEAEIIPIPEFAFSGKNLKNFLILTDTALQENHLKALESTLLRKQMGLDDVSIVDFSAYPNATFDQLNASFMPQKLVCFGLKPETIGLPETELNQISTFNNCQILYTYSFNNMLGDKEKTKAFWEPMKLL
ncbi:hypothetical protein [Mucilaginibacter arboris]|uniref:Uncharacterized protein n=1 Tax=Mucilaginibacter arboris TaxID=2682090 RepID=A0A7K1SWP0_9SPHI|nr:hypothetical protein [Mucilaginibacter arboris]MVN21658.1 hypothetical protein [Mucilaginibacter arboris]